MLYIFQVKLGVSMFYEHDKKKIGQLFLDSRQWPKSDSMFLRHVGKPRMTSRANSRKTYVRK